MKNKDYGTHAGTGPYEGMFWNGREWIGEPTEAAMALRRADGWTAGTPGAGHRSPMTRDQRLMQAVIYAVLAVFCTTAAIPLVMVFGLSIGALATVVALLVGGLLALTAFIQSQQRR